MTTCALQRELDKIRRHAEILEYRAIRAARLQYVVPLCERRNWHFSAGMGSWCFWSERGDHFGYDDDRIPKRVQAVLKAEVLNSSQDAGSLMQDYMPKGFKRRDR